MTSRCQNLVGRCQNLVGRCQNLSQNCRRSELVWAFRTWSQLARAVRTVSRFSQFKIYEYLTPLHRYNWRLILTVHSLKFTLHCYNWRLDSSDCVQLDDVCAPRVRTYYRGVRTLPMCRCGEKRPWSPPINASLTEFPQIKGKTMEFRPNLIFI